VHPKNTGWLQFLLIILLRFFFPCHIPDLLDRYFDVFHRLASVELIGYKIQYDFHLFICHSGYHFGSPSRHKLAVFALWLPN
jgi:hypothetical protein